ncbi:(Fe-S)-binding protein [candidate division KSB1 bacterium]
MTETTSFDYEKLLNCIHCGLCLSSCPSYVVLRTETDSPRGRIFMMRAIEENRLEVDRSVKKHLDYCLVCRGCETACPSGVDYHPLLEQAQQKIKEKVKQPLFSRIVRTILLKLIFPYPRRLKSAFMLLYLYQRSGLQWMIRRSGILRIFSLKIDLAERFLPRIEKLSGSGKKETVQTAGSKKEELVGFMRGCVMDYFYPQTNDATIRVLEKCGCGIVIPEKLHCCGAVHMHNGEFGAARTFAKQVIDVFLESGAGRIVTNAAGCGAMMKEYARLLADDDEYAHKAARFSAMVYDISEYLVDKSNKLTFGRFEETAVYDDPCHLIHAQHISKQPRQILESIPGLKIVPLNEAEMCCGSAGTFNIVQPELSTEVLKRKMENIRLSGANTVITGNVGCLIQLTRGRHLSGMNLTVLHTIDVVDRALRSADS